MSKKNPVIEIIIPIKPVGIIKHKKTIINVNQYGPKIESVWEIGVSIKANPNKTQGNPVNKKDLKNSANEKKIISLRREIFLFLKSFLKLAK